MSFKIPLLGAALTLLQTPEAGHLTQALPLRAAPADSAAVVAQLERGREAVALQHQSGWVQIRLGTLTGWVPESAFLPAALEAALTKAAQSRRNRSGLVRLEAGTATRGGCPYPIPAEAPSGAVPIAEAQTWKACLQASLYVWRPADETSGDCPTDVILRPGDAFRLRFAASRDLFLSLYRLEPDGRATPLLERQRLERGDLLSFPPTEGQLNLDEPGLHRLRLVLWSAGPLPGSDAPAAPLSFGQTFTEVRLPEDGRAVSATLLLHTSAPEAHPQLPRAGGR